MLAVKEELLDYASFVSFVRNMVSERMGEDTVLNCSR